MSKLIKVVLYLNTDQDAGAINDMVHELAAGAERHYPAEHYKSTWSVERGGDEA